MRRAKGIGGWVGAAPQRLGVPVVQGSPLLAASGTQSAAKPVL